MLTPVMILPPASVAGQAESVSCLKARQSTSSCWGKRYGLNLTLRTVPSKKQLYGNPGLLHRLILSDLCKRQRCFTSMLTKFWPPLLGVMSAQVLYGQSLTEARTRCLFPADHDSPQTDPNVLLTMVFGSCFPECMLGCFC